LVVGDGKRLIRVDHVDAMQAQLAKLGAGWFVGADVAVAVNLARVHRNQLAAQPFGNADGQLVLAAGRRPDDRREG
jgi:hypothetical protein